MCGVVCDGHAVRGLEIGARKVDTSRASHQTISWKCSSIQVTLHYIN